VHGYNASYLEAEAEDQEFETSVGYIMSLRPDLTTKRNPA
jgi:hypothetical protein